MATRKRATKKRSARGGSKRAAAKSSKSKTAKKTARKTTSKTAGKTAKKKSGRKSTRKAAKRTLIAPKGDKRYVRRTARGRFKESDDVGASLSTDRRTHAKRKAPRGQGDKGD